MSGSLEEAYVAVERAYSQADFAGALQLAQALHPQVPPGRPDLLDQRLQLLIGHVHLYGLNQPAEAAAAYTAVLNDCSEASYRELAAQGFEISQQQMPVVVGQQSGEPHREPEPPTTATPPAEPAATASQTATAGAMALPATPWLNQLQDPQQALQQIQAAWATATPAKAPTAAATAATATAAIGAAAPWQPSAGDAATVGEAGFAITATAVEPESAALPNSTDAEPSGLVVQTAESSPAQSSESESSEAEAERDVATPQMIIPVVVTVEENGLSAEAATDAGDAAAQTAEDPGETTPKPEPQATPSLSEDEWADFKRGLLLVELSTSSEAPTR